MPYLCGLWRFANAYRLELYYEESGLMEINSEGEGKGTEAVIYIPVHEN